MAIRVALTDFALANALYSSAQVTVYEVNENLQQTATLATLYAAPTGGTLRSNPFNLNSEGAFPEVRYVDKPVILRVVPTDAVPETLGVQGQAARFRGTWVTGTLYYPGERVREPSGPSTYLVLTGHTSATFLTDVGNGLLEKELDGASIAAAAAAIAVTSTVLKAGDTMTGDFAIAKATPTLDLNATGLTRARLRLLRGSLARFVAYLENDAESGGDVGGSLKLDSYTDAGVFKENIITVDRATGLVQFAKLPAVTHGDCRFDYVSTTSVKLSPYNGNRLVISGIARTIPSAGVSIANTGLANSTLYYAYAYWTGSAIALELSTTGNSLHTDGVRIKTGDASRTLVGMLYTTAASNLFQAGLVTISWFNRRLRAGNVTFNTATASTSPVPLNTANPLDILTWLDGGAHVVFAGYGSMDTAIANHISAIHRNGVLASGQSLMTSVGVSYGFPLAVNAAIAGIEGHSRMQAYGWVGGGLGSWTATNLTVIAEG